MKILPSVGSPLGSANRGYSKASFSRRSWGRIRWRVNSSVQWQALSPASRSSATRLIRAAKRGVISGSPRLSLMNRGGGRTEACSSTMVEHAYPSKTTSSESPSRSSWRWHRYTTDCGDNEVTTRYQNKQPWCMRPENRNTRISWYLVQSLASIHIALQSGWGQRWH
jgi:hypothetical protein